MTATHAAPVPAIEAAQAVRAGAVSAHALLEETLARIEKEDAALNCFTRVFAERARKRAAAIDRAVAAGEPVGPLAGAPFAVKDLFDVAGYPTTAGAKMRAGAAPAARDAVAVARLEAAGAVLVGALNMDEFAYGFSTENAHYGVTRNPHDPARLAGGSSGGSAAAVAAGLAPLTLGSDTNGSIRVPASLCGVFGLRPTHGAVPETGVFPFVERLDVAGPFARTIEDIALSFEVLCGVSLPAVNGPLRAARLTGWFHENADADARARVDVVCDALGVTEAVDLGETEAARSAAFMITASEGGRRHLDGLRADAAAFDDATRARFVAGALVPDRFVQAAEIVARRFIAAFEATMTDRDVLVAPATPCVAPLIEKATIVLNGRAVPARANLGLLAQPISLTGAPVLCVPVRAAGKLPLGVQLIAARGREAVLIAAAKRLAAAGIVGCVWPGEAT